jgi:hypothetical protein
VVLVVVGVLAGCGGSSASQQPSNSEIDQINQRVSDLNAAFEWLRVGVNACDPTASAQAIASCFDQAYTSSGIDSVLAAFGQHVRQVEGRLASGDCRSSLGQFEADLVALRTAVTTMKRDADAGDVSSLVSDGHAVQDAWKASTGGETQSDKACWSARLAGTILNRWMPSRICLGVPARRAGPAWGRHAPALASPAGRRTRRGRRRPPRRAALLSFLCGEFGGVAFGERVAFVDNRAGSFLEAVGKFGPAGEDHTFSRLFGLLDAVR